MKEERVIRISVRNLVEFILREGDIDNRISGSMEKDAMLQGGRMHRKIQRRMGPEYHAEYALKMRIPCGEYQIQLEGRADGVIVREKDGKPDVVIDEIKGGATFCGMSALMTSTMMVMKDTIDVLKDQGLRDQVTVMVGGAPVTQVFCEKIGADIYGESASETTEKAKAILEQ